MLTTFDIIILVVLLIAAIRGAIKGFVWQLAVIGSILLCFAFSETGSIHIAPLLPLDAPLNRWVAMLILYGVLSFAAFGIARMMHNWIEKMKFKEYDRHLGFIFGGVKGVIFCLIATFFVVTISDGYRATVMNSYSGHAAAVIMDRLHPVMPAELHDVLEPYIHQLDHPGLDLQHAHHDDDPDHEHADTDNDSFWENEETDDSVIDKLLENFKGQTTQNISALGTLLKETFRKVSPADREKFLKEIRNSAPEKLQAVADAWNQGKSEVEDSLPPFDFEPPPFDNDIGTTARENLIKEIVATFNAGAEASAEVTRVISDELVGIPDQVAASVLRDWHADLAKTTPDPVPETDASMTLDSRILVHLKKANVPLSSLSAALQERLSESLR